MGEPFHVEVTTSSGASKWIRGVASHTVDELESALKDSEILTIVDVDGSKTVVDFGEVFMVRTQDDKIFRKRSREVEKKHGRK